MALLTEISTRERTVAVIGAFLILLPIARLGAGDPALTPFGLVIVGLMTCGYRYSLEGVFLECRTGPPNRKRVVLWGGLAATTIILNLVVLEWLRISYGHEATAVIAR